MDMSRTVRPSPHAPAPAPRRELGLRWLLAIPILALLTACSQGPTAAPPSAPTDLATEVGPGYITVSWTDTSSDETGFLLYRDDAAGIRSQQADPLVELPADTTSYVDHTAVPGRSYRYSVAAESGGGTSSAAPHAGDPVAVETGVELVAGTYNILDRFNLSAFLYYVVLPPGTVLQASETFTITGPPGWNDDEVAVSEIDRALVERGWIVDLDVATPVSGTYTIEVTIDGINYSDEVTLDADSTMPAPTDVMPTAVSTGEVSASWSSVSDARSYRFFLREDPDVFSSPLLGDTFVTGTGGTIGGLDLAPGAYQVEVTAYPIDWTVPDGERPLHPGVFDIAYGESELFAVTAEGSACLDHEELVSVPDDALAQAIRDALGLGGGELTCGNLLDLVGLDAEDAGVVDLTGLEHAVNLEELSVENGGVSDLAPIAGLPQLGELVLDGTAVGDDDLPTLVTLPSLTYLDLDKTAITDLSTIVGLATLSGLSLNRMPSLPLSEIERIATLTDLERLFLDQFIGDDLSFLAPLTRLRRLLVADADIADIGVVANFPDLEWLHLADNAITDITPLQSLGELRELDLKDNPDLSDISTLTSLPRLERVALNRTAVRDITPLASLVAPIELHLQGLDLDDGEIAFLADRTSLEILELQDNLIGDTSTFANLIHLTELELLENAITDIGSLSGLPDLEVLLLQDNQITDITPLVDNPGIGDGDRIDVSDNLLDLAPGSDDRDAIDVLIGRGVELVFEPQQAP